MQSLLLFRKQKQTGGFVLCKYIHTCINIDFFIKNCIFSSQKDELFRIKFIYTKNP